MAEPQGSIDAGEMPRQAVLRELKEEIGMDNAEIIAESRGWLYYDLPQKLARTAWGGRCKGQRQKWFVMLFKGADRDIVPVNIPSSTLFRWRRSASSLLLSNVNSTVGEFATILRD
jgi:putative (di)nucleoside polyphosphate hydrolase